VWAETQRLRPRRIAQWPRTEWRPPRRTGDTSCTPTYRGSTAIPTRGPERPTDASNLGTKRSFRRRLIAGESFSSSVKDEATDSVHRTLRSDPYVDLRQLRVSAHVSAAFLKFHLLENPLTNRLELEGLRSRREFAKASCGLPKRLSLTGTPRTRGNPWGGTRERDRRRQNIDAFASRERGFEPDPGPTPPEPAETSLKPGDCPTHSRSAPDVPRWRPTARSTAPNPVADRSSPRETANGISLKLRARPGE
jgi:hypothetical protein